MISSHACTISTSPVIWLTGMPASGKTTIAKALYPKLKESGFKIELLDGDIVRKELSPELGFIKKTGRCMLNGLYTYANYYQEMESSALFA